MNMDLYNHGTLGVASDKKKKLLSALEMFFGGGGALGGLGSFANHRSKNRTFSHFETLQKNQKNYKNTLPRTTQQTGKSKHCWLEEIWRWFSDGVFKKEKKKTWELKCTFLLMAARQEMSRGRRWWACDGGCARPCRLGISSVLLKSLGWKFLNTKSIFVLFVSR